MSIRSPYAVHDTCGSLRLTSRQTVRGLSLTKQSVAKWLSSISGSTSVPVCLRSGSIEVSRDATGVDAVAASRGCQCIIDTRHPPPIRLLLLYGPAALPVPATVDIVTQPELHSPCNSFQVQYSRPPNLKINAGNIELASRNDAGTVISDSSWYTVSRILPPQ